MVTKHGRCDSPHAASWLLRHSPSSGDAAAAEAEAVQLPYMATTHDPYSRSSWQSLIWRCLLWQVQLHRWQLREMVAALKTRLQRLARGEAALA